MLALSYQKIQDSLDIKCGNFHDNWKIMTPSHRFHASTKSLNRVVPSINATQRSIKSQNFITQTQNSTFFILFYAYKDTKLWKKKSKLLLFFYFFFKFCVSTHLWKIITVLNNCLIIIFILFLKVNFYFIIQNNWSHNKFNHINHLNLKY